MQSVSAHGQLEHVDLCVSSITMEGITILIKNLPKLLSFCTNCISYTCAKENLRDSLQLRFPDRKLFRIGSFTVGQDFVPLSARTDFLPLWEHLIV